MFEVTTEVDITRDRESRSAILGRGRSQTACLVPLRLEGSQGPGSDSPSTTPVPQPFFPLLWQIYDNTAAIQRCRKCGPLARSRLDKIHKGKLNNLRSVREVTLTVVAAVRAWKPCFMPSDCSSPRYKIPPLKMSLINRLCNFLVLQYVYSYVLWHDAWRPE
jgi:hypothetical protein